MYSKNHLLAIFDSHRYYANLLWGQNQRDCQQVSFTTLNRFCPYVTSPSYSAHNGKYQAGWNTNQNQIKNMCQAVFLFLVLHQVLHQLISFFLQIFRTSFNIICKKIFVTNFPFLMDLPKHSHSLNDNVHKCSIMSIYAHYWGFFIVRPS